MIELRYTLLTDGSSDKTLMNIIKWVLDDIYPKLPCHGSFADLRPLPNPPPFGNVIQRIKRAEELYPFDILFYHRDAENNDNNIIKKRKDEIFGKIDAQLASKIVCVVPITMMETWLLIDRDAIKKASGNRNYSDAVVLPAISKLEKIKDPKKELHQILKTCSNLKGRREKMFNEDSAVHLVAEYINDYSPLRQLSAFKEFEQDLKIAVSKLYC
jgi:hypothetical protein